MDTFKRGLHKLRGEGSMDEILDTFLLTYRTTPKTTLLQQQSPAELFLGCTPRTSLDLLLLPKQPTERDTTMERQFNRKHGAVTRGFKVEDPVYVRHHHSQDWKATSVSKQIRGRLYDITFTDGSTCRFHVNQMSPRAHIGQKTTSQTSQRGSSYLCHARKRPERELDLQTSGQQTKIKKTAARNIPKGTTTRGNQVRW